MASNLLPTPNLIYGTAWKEERTAALIEMAIRAGFRAIDTANQRKHYNEAEVGEGLAAAYRAGVVTRNDLFLQTKFTYLGGQDHRLPYDQKAKPAVQVAQSLASSLEHLGTDHVDSFVLHGPSSGYEWTDMDAEVWESMVRERDAGRARMLGVSNVSLRHLQQMAAKHDVRAFCTERKILYQGFSLLTANAEVANHSAVTKPASRLQATPAQIVFAFSRGVGMLPLTGTTNAEHMKQDLAAMELTLTPNEFQSIEEIAD